ALSSPSLVATNTRAAACSSAVGLPVGAGLGDHAVTAPLAVTCARPGRAMPATCVNDPAMNQPPAPSGIIAVTSPSGRGSSPVAWPAAFTSVQPPVLGPT